MTPLNPLSFHSENEGTMNVSQDATFGNVKGPVTISVPPVGDGGAQFKLNTGQAETLRDWLTKYLEGKP